uniref:TIL domain-containing protein n=1 Tax=Anopheles funestus TaxID=62324 RepID=A0A4Y0BDR7_ANOFN
MLYRLIVLAIVLSMQLLLLNAQSPEPESNTILCRRNEAYSTCGSRCMEPKCGNSLTMFCPKICQSGCYCIADYARNQNGNCVPYKRVNTCQKPNVPTGCTIIAKCG